MADNNKFTRKLTQDNFITEKIDVIQNNLLGSYDSEGKYTIAPQIVEELIKMNKLKKTVFGNSIFCVGNLLGYGEIVFELLFDSKTRGNSFAQATIYVLEEVDKINGYLQNTIKTKLETFSHAVDGFIEETYKHFNIVSEEDDEDDDEGKERKLLDDLNNEDSFIIAKKQYSLLLEKLLSDKYLDAYGKYFTSRMSALTRLGNDFCVAVLDSFNRQYQLIDNVFLYEKNYKMLNELLDKAIEETSATKPEFVKQEREFEEKTAGALESFTDNVEKLSERYESKALNMLEKDDRKKVEEMLDEHSHEVQEDVRESKPNVQQMVNEVKGAEPKQAEPAPETVAQGHGDATAYIKDKLDNKQVKTGVEQSQPSFYDTFTTSNRTNSQTQESVTMEGANPDAEAQEKKGVDDNWRARINRLQSKFSRSTVSENANPHTSSYGSMMDKLSREKQIKARQVSNKNLNLIESIESMSNDEMDFDR